MNAVWNSYGQLCGCPEIFKKSCKFFCRELDIRVPDIMHSDWFYTSQCFIFLETFLQCSRYNRKQPLIFRKSIMFFRILLHLFLKKIRNINGTD